MSKAKELVEILDRMSSEWVTSNEEEDAFHVANAVLVAGVVAEAREPLRAALAAALPNVPTVKALTIRLGRFNGAWWDRFASEILAALDGWTLVRDAGNPWADREKDNATIATLRVALELCVETIKWTEGFVLDDAMETWKRGTRAALDAAKETP